jgi:hypothetical protein
VDWWFCKTHEWCKHKNADCKGITGTNESGGGGRNSINNGGNAAMQPTANTNNTGGDRAGRMVRAVGAVVVE